MAGGVVIEYPAWSVEEPVVLPKFTFKILGTKETIEAFGVIGETTHRFTLSCPDYGWQWTGYLVGTLFNIANTGFDEEIELNGIHELEALKYLYFDLTYSSLMPLTETIKAIVAKIRAYTVVFSFSFSSPANLGCAGVNNWYDEDNNPMNIFDVLKYICTFYSLVFEHDFEAGNVRVTSYTEFQRQPASVVDYSTVRHRGINESYSVGENWLSAKNVGSILKPEDVLVNLSASPCQEDPYLYTLHRSWKRATKTVWEENLVYETRVHVIEKDEFRGWSFPKYRQSDNQPIANWWDRSGLFNGTRMCPVAGMYRVSFRAYVQDNSYPAVPMTDLFVVKSYNNNNDATTASMLPDSTVYANFNSEFTASADNFLLFSGKIGAGAKMTTSWFRDDDHSYYDIEAVNSTTWAFYGNIMGFNGGHPQLWVPNMNFYQSGFYYPNGQSPLLMRVKFKDMYWSDLVDDWTVSPTVFTVQTDEKVWLELPLTISSIKNKPFVGNVPLYEELGQGYAIRFGKRQDGSGTANVGTGELTVDIFVKQQFNAPITMWLQDFNFNLVNQKDSIEVKTSPQAPTYSYGNDKKPAYSTVTNYLMSEFEDVTSFSQVYKDTEGATMLEDIAYSLPVFVAKGTTSTFTVSERPEEHQLRVIKELVSARVVLSDVIPVADLQKMKQVVYNGKLLVRDAFSIDCLNDMCNVDFVVRRVNYS
jgi:hypothetical protein